MSVHATNSFEEFSFKGYHLILLKAAQSQSLVRLAESGSNPYRQIQPLGVATLVVPLLVNGNTFTPLTGKSQVTNRTSPCGERIRLERM
jgi:hypothetical protein